MQINSPNKIKFMWIPGHAIILGNELADYAAKNVARTPCFMHDCISSRDILSEIAKLRRMWSNYIHHYSAINTARNKPTYEPGIPLCILKPFTRLRLGHAIVTHQHLLKRLPPNSCPYCEEQASVKHILTCPSCKQYINTCNQ